MSSEVPIVVGLTCAGTAIALVLSHNLRSPRLALALTALAPGGYLLAVTFC